MCLAISFATRKCVCKGKIDDDKGEGGVYVLRRNR